MSYIHSIAKVDANENQNTDIDRISSEETDVWFPQRRDPLFWTRFRSILLKSEGLSSAQVGKQADIVPMVLDGSAKALPEKGFLPRTKQAVSLHILSPVPYDVFKDMPVREVAEYIHHIAAEELARMRGVPTLRHS